MPRLPAGRRRRPSFLNTRLRLPAVGHSRTPSPIRLDQAHGTQPSQPSSPRYRYALLGSPWGRSAGQDILPWFELLLRESAPDRFVGERRVLGHRYERISQELHGPAGPALRRLRACRRHEQSLFLSRELPAPARSRLVIRTTSKGRSTKRFLARKTVDVPTPTIRAMSLS